MLRPYRTKTPTKLGHPIQKTFAKPVLQFVAGNATIPVKLKHGGF